MQLAKSNQYTFLYQFVFAVILVVFAAVFIRTAWLGDDAFITFRTIDNLIHGHGLVWNIGERVQTFTHPLWLLLLVLPYSLTHEAYFTVIFFSILISLGTVYWLMAKLTNSLSVSLVIGTVLLASHAFIDFSTSGLENVLTHILIVLFGWIYLGNSLPANKKFFIMSLLAGLATVNRLDTVILFLPVLLVELFSQFSWKRLGCLILGMLPVVIWETFALIYYGFLFPNTYYAKVATGIPLMELIHQGFIYVINSLTLDPATLLTIISCVILAFILRKFQSQLLGVGSVLYILYVVSVGGDFMSGRFFSAPFLLAIVALIPLLEFCLASFEKQQTKLVLGSVSLFCIATLLVLSAPLIRNPEILPTGITDERSFFFATNGLSNIVRSKVTPPHSWALYGASEGTKAASAGESRHIVDFPNVGMLGYFGGPNVYLIDYLGLVDPFLAHLPINLANEWRVGHYGRILPAGYEASKQSNTNLITDPKLAMMYDDVQIIIKDPLFSPVRWQKILQFNTLGY